MYGKDIFLAMNYVLRIMNIVLAFAISLAPLERIRVRAFFVILSVAKNLFRFGRAPRVLGVGLFAFTPHYAAG
jgi:hypothetical protein